MVGQDTAVRQRHQPVMDIQGLGTAVSQFQPQISVPFMGAGDDLLRRNLAADDIGQTGAGVHGIWFGRQNGDRAARVMLPDGFGGRYPRRAVADDEVVHSS